MGSKMLALHTIGREKALHILHAMMLARKFDEVATELAFGRVWTSYSPIHRFVIRNVGEEAALVVPCTCLRQTDFVMPHVHRGVPSALGKGADPKKLMADALARKSGYSKGRNRWIAGAPEVGVLASGGILGADIAVAVGVALACKIRGSDEVTLVFFGDGTSNRGEFHESTNMAAIWKLPVVFLVVHNRYSGTAAAEDVLATKDVATRAKAYGIPGMVVDGNDALAVYQATSEAVERAREGRGPTLLECQTFLVERASSETGVSDEEAERWRKRDPIVNLKSLLVGEGILTEDEASAMEAQVASEVEAAVSFAQESPQPTREELLVRS